MSDENKPLLTPLQKAYLAANPEATLAENAPEKSEQSPVLEGVGGWLQFLILALTVLGPLVTVATTFGELADTDRLYPTLNGNDAWAKAKVISWFTVAAFCGLSVGAGYLLQTRHKRSTIPIVILLIWLAGPIVTICGFAIVSNIVGSEGSDAGELGRSLGRPIVFCTIWSIYLLRSKRVKNTYLRDAKVDATPRWQAISRTKRQYAFFAASWIVLAFLYFQLITPLDVYPEDAEVRRMWAIILLPPILLAAGWWGYARFVGIAEKNV